jgi:hypothetical protein
MMAIGKTESARAKGKSIVQMVSFGMMVIGKTESARAKGKSMVQMASFSMRANGNTFPDVNGNIVTATAKENYTTRTVIFCTMAIGNTTTLIITATFHIKASKKPFSQLANTTHGKTLSTKASGKMENPMAKGSCTMIVASFATMDSGKTENNTARDNAIMRPGSFCTMVNGKTIIQYMRLNTKTDTCASGITETVNCTIRTVTFSMKVCGNTSSMTKQKDTFKALKGKSIT